MLMRAYNKNIINLTENLDTISFLNSDKMEQNEM